MKEKIKIGFIGYGTRALDALMEHPLFEVKYFFAPKAKLCQDVYDAQKRYADRLTMEVIENNRQLAERFAQISDVECFLMNACPIILKQEVLAHMRVFNIHPGDLRTNRGHQPHMWTVLLGEPATKLTLHTVGVGIDEGTVIKSVTVPVSPEDDALMVLDRAEDEAPKLLDALYAYLKEGAAPEGEITGGAYRSVMQHADYEVDFAQAAHDEEAFSVQLRRRIYARVMHHGAFFVHGGKRVYIDKILSVGPRTDGGTQPAITICREEKLVEALTGKYRYTFRLNKEEEL